MASKKSAVFRLLFIVVSVLAITYCLAWFVFGVRLDYEARKIYCGGDKVCKAKLWLEYKKK